MCDAVHYVGFVAGGDEKGEEGMNIWPWTELKRLRLEVETLKMQLAAVDMAAVGEFRGCREEWRSPALENVLELRRIVEKK
jgi:hypothetical protein